MRLAIPRIAILVALTLGALISERSVSHAQDGGGLRSGGLGATRAVWEETHGPGEPVDTFSPVWGELNAYGFDNGTFYAAFAGSKADASGVLVSLEIVFTGEGVPSEEARAAVGAFLPSDAGIAEPYFLPPSPGTPSALNAFRYESAALATVPYGTGTLLATFLVVYVEQYAVTRIASDVDASINVETTVSRVSIAAAIPEG